MIMLSDEQRARQSNATAARLRAIVEETRTAHEVCLLTYAVEGQEERLHDVVAAHAAIDTATRALVSYIVHGACYGREPGEAQDAPLHELCRKARLCVSEKVQAVLSNRALIPQNDARSQGLDVLQSADDLAFDAITT